MIRNSRSALSLLSCLLIIMVNACSWYRMPPKPEYSMEPPIPIKVGLILSEDPTSIYLGQKIYFVWKEMKLFDTLVYPYREGDQVDAVIRLSINGTYEGEFVAAGILIGLTWGLASTVVGPSVTATHTAIALITGVDQVGMYSVTAKTKVMAGVGADPDEVGGKQEDLQARYLAVGLSTQLRSDQKKLEELRFKKAVSTLNSQHSMAPHRMDGPPYGGRNSGTLGNIAICELP